jgi:hypothetical protein
MSPGKHGIRQTHDNVDDHIDVSDLKGLVGRLNIGPTCKWKWYGRHCFGGPVHS